MVACLYGLDLAGAKVIGVPEDVEIAIGGGRGAGGGVVNGKG